MQKSTWQQASLDLGELDPIPAPEPPSEDIPDFGANADLELLHQCPPVEFWTPPDRRDR